MQLSEFIGQDILLSIPSLTSTKIQKAKLLGVETGGIWIESELINTTLLRAANLAALPHGPRVFFPYGQIAVLIVGGGAPALDERAFGL
jgi:hypothetical protein